MNKITKRENKINEVVASPTKMRGLFHPISYLQPNKKNKVHIYLIPLTKQAQGSSRPKNRRQDHPIPTYLETKYILRANRKVATWSSGHVARKDKETQKRFQDTHFIFKGGRLILSSLEFTRSFTPNNRLPSGVDCAFLFFYFISKAGIHTASICCLWLTQAITCRRGACL